MLQQLSAILGEAKESKYGVPALAAENELMMHAALRAAEESRSPVILLTGYSPTVDDCFFMDTVLHYSDIASVPVTVIRDHTSTSQAVAEGIRMRFPAIMVDRSDLPFDENVAQVKKLTSFCHSVGVEVEAELGHVGHGVALEDKGDSESKYTVPNEAVSYVEQTQVDCLAVSIGTSHGIYAGGIPELQFDRLKELADKVPVPLVLHGASGTGDVNISKACREGITKVNVGTDLYQALLDGVINTDLCDGNAYKVFKAMEESYVCNAKHWFTVCGSSDKA